MFDYVKFASDVHASDTYGNLPYAVHLQDVADRVSDDLKPLAWCHDLIEDHPEVLPDLRRLVPTEFLFQVLLITRRDSESYLEYIRRINNFGNTPARRVKIADIHANLARVPSPSLTKRYQDALHILEM